MRPFRLPTLLLVLALAGCATVVNVPNAQLQAQSVQARQFFSLGQFQQAAQAYQTLAASHRDASDYYLLRAAEAWRDNGSLAQAAQVLSQVQRDRLQATDARHYDLLEAEIALQHGDTTRALQLTSAPISDLPTALQVRALLVRARALAVTGNPWQAALARIQLNPLLPDAQRNTNRAQALKLLTSLGVPALQQHASALAANDPARHWIAEALNQMGVSVATAAPAMTQPIGTLLPGTTQAEGYQLPQKVALILPLSGPLAVAGDAVRQGFFASYFQASTNGQLPPVTVYDSAGTTAGAVAAYQQAVAAGATQVVGPLTHDAVGAVLQQAALPVPVLALNYPDDNTLPPPDATEFSLRPEVEGTQVARYMYQQGITQAIVLVSSEDFAQRAAKAFITQFQGEGGQVTTTLTLDPTQVDYAAQIKTLGAALGQANTGIFISMRPEQARLLMPQLHLAKINLPVFATSEVYDARDNPVADSDLDGITFCDAPWLFNAQPGLPARALLASALPLARGTSARLFAFGMDAWSLVPYLQWLRDHPGSYLPGASGQLTEDAFGRVNRMLVWARFKDGVAQPLAGSLEMGAPVTQPAAAASSTTAPSSVPVNTAQGQPPATPVHD
ncbi:MAG TPA: penicillin-binding protein activator [Rhodanobacteraceae bacterium]